MSFLLDTSLGHASHSLAKVLLHRHLAQPLGQLGGVALESEALVQENDGAEVVLVPDDATDGLVQGPEGLQVVPLGAADPLARLVLHPVRVQKLFLQYHLWIFYAWSKEDGMIY